MKLHVKVQIELNYLFPHYIEISKFWGGYRSKINGYLFKTIGSIFCEKEYPDGYMSNEILVSLTKIKVPCCDVTASGSTTIDLNNKAVIFNGVHSVWPFYDDEAFKLLNKDQINEHLWDKIQSKFINDGWKIRYVLKPEYADIKL